MLDLTKRKKLWGLVLRTARNSNIEIPDQTHIDFWEYMRTIEGDIRYIIVEHYNLSTGFFYKAYEEEDVKGKAYMDKIKYMFEDYFENDGGSWEEILFIDLKTNKAYLIDKEKKAQAQQSIGTETIKFFKKQVR